MNYIDLDKILKDSYPKTASKIPKPFLSLIKKIIRQDAMNDIINRYKECNGYAFLQNVIREFDLKIEVKGLENLPDNPKCILAANHPFGILDGLIVTKIAFEKYKSLQAIGNDAFLFIPQLREFITAINVFGKNSRDEYKKLDELFRSDTTITTFPSGEVSRMYGFQIQDCEWKKSFVVKARETGRPVVPVRFFGRNSLLFYSIFLFRKLFFIRANIELILLPNEIFNKKHKTIRVVIGKPVDTQSPELMHVHPGIIAEKIRKIIYSLR